MAWPQAAHVCELYAGGTAFCLRSLGHILNAQNLKNIQIERLIDDEGMTGLMGILVMHAGLILLISGRFTIGFLLIL